MWTRRVTLFGALAGLAAGLQAAHALLPSPAGDLVALLSSLPVAVGTLIFRERAPWLGAAAAALLALINPEAAVEFALTTGPLGLAVGYGVQAGRPVLSTVTLAGFTLAVGMVALALVTVDGWSVPGTDWWGLGPLAAASVYMAVNLLVVRVAVCLLASITRPERRSWWR